MSKDTLKQKLCLYLEGCQFSEGVRQVRVGVAATKPACAHCNFKPNESPQVLEPQKWTRQPEDNSEFDEQDKKQ